MSTCRRIQKTVKLSTKVVHDKPIPHAKQNCKASTDVIMLKFERLRRKALNLKRLYLSSLHMKLCKIC